MSLGIDVDTASIRSILTARRKLSQALKKVDADGIEEVVRLATLQAMRYVWANIEVDTSRTKSSVFPAVTRVGNGADGVLGTNVSYSPFVRDASHTKPFFDYAAENEGPRLAQFFGAEINVRVENAFNE